MLVVAEALDPPLLIQRLLLHPSEGRNTLIHTWVDKILKKCLDTSLKLHPETEIWESGTVDGLNINPKTPLENMNLQRYSNANYILTNI